MSVRNCLLFLLMVNALLIQSTAAQESTSYHSQYAGQEKRTIKSLSADDIQQLKSGKGWGMAKAAELNGMPGPVHILQMKQKISLSKEQETKIKALYEDMKTKAIPLGNKLIQLEQALNDAFADQSVTEESLKQQLDSIANVRKQLRYVHLVTHLATPKILSPHQIMQYNRLRGYGSADPCNNIPPGHDARMWKMHNGCK